MAAPTPPLARLVLRATSVADDVGFVALRDLSQVMAGDDYRMIGGHMVMALVARWALGDDLYRQTQDTDRGVHPIAVQGPEIVDQLGSLGYERQSGNRFARPVLDVPVRLAGIDAPLPRAVIDILVPSYTSRPRQNRKFGKHLATVEVPGLAAALQRPAAGADRATADTGTSGCDLGPGVGADRRRARTSQRRCRLPGSRTRHIDRGHRVTTGVFDANRATSTCRTRGS